ncbi:hypothetical protein EDB81DRAFT_931074 [Dactylonectria macrodidyma]|uniref:Actin-like ATPase domain-containing protein n=1 Tax=Dactylonectria macrodidyma TaxID=307937 RepID=A0A9P9F4X5_9HYPO|nr:hypothetical protein EDB81DRAFT_931074 [Dactylonectria macrodidyma]
MEPSQGRCSRAYGSGVISIDFGFTSSAAAVTIPTEGDSNATEFSIIEKFATKLLVKDPEEPNFSFIVPGTDNNTVGRKLCYFKALLMDSFREQPGDTEVMEACIASAQGLDLPEDPNVVSIFLKGLWGEARNLLGSFLAGSHSGRDGLPHVVVTYPGIWNESELRRLKLAVRNAGIEKECCQGCGVRYCTEQAAAVHAVLFDYPEQLEPQHENGESMIVADCGGLTLDAATYEFCSPSVPRSSESLGEIVDAKSSFTGGLSLNIAFDNMISDNLKRVSQRSDDQLLTSSLRRRAEAGKWFEHNIKPKFGDLRRNPYDDVWRFSNVAGCEVVIDRANMVRTFDPIIETIVAHIVELYARAKARGKQPKVVFLTGGVSQSPRIQNWVRKKLKKVDIDLQLIISTLYESVGVVGRVFYLKLDYRTSKFG